MHDYNLLFGSATYAMKAKRLLAKEGVACTLIKQAGRKTEGCNHALQISSADSFRATLLLRDAGIPYRVEN